MSTVILVAKLDHTDVLDLEKPEVTFHFTGLKAKYQGIPVDGAVLKDGRKTLCLTNDMEAGKTYMLYVGGIDINKDDQLTGVILKVLEVQDEIIS